MRSLFRDRSGNIAILSALVLPVILGFVGGAIDFYRWHSERGNLKELADTLATRGAREFLLANASGSQVEAVVQNIIDSGFSKEYGFDRVQSRVVVDPEKGEVSVRLVVPPSDGLILTNFMPFMADLDITSVAVALGGMNVCVVALEEADPGAVAIQVNSKLIADECSLMSNSTSTQGVIATGLSDIDAGMICSAGGAFGGAQNFNPAPTLDCPVYEDPLSERVAPSVGPCTHYDASYGERVTEIATAAAAALVTGVSGTLDEVTGGLTGGLTGGVVEGIGRGLTKTYNLSPGVYCGGLGIGQFADVHLAPGTYVIKDGPLLVGLGGKFHGEDVSFYMVGDDATFYFGPEAIIELSAQKAGPLAGILFFEDRHAPMGRLHNIMSDDARTLLGTFYLPRGVLNVASVLPVADRSAYTAIVAHKMQMTGSPTLVLNVDYNATDVPVPQGIGPVGGTTYLRE